MNTGPWHEAQAAGLEQAGAGDVRREQVGRALDAGRVAGRQGARDGAGEQRLAGARDVLEQHVAVGEQRDRDQPQRLVAADDGPCRRRRRRSAHEAAGPRHGAASGAGRARRSLGRGSAACAVGLHASAAPCGGGLGRTEAYRRRGRAGSGDRGGHGGRAHRP